MEYAAWVLDPKVNMNLLVIGVYRPPYSAAHPISVNTFMDDLPDLLCDYLPKYRLVTIMGDFNIPFDDQDDPHKKFFYDLCSTFGIIQKVNCVLTHTDTHWISS